MMIRDVSRISAGVLGFLAALAATSALAQSAQSLGQYRDWDAYKLTRDGQTTCYAVSVPTDIAPKNVNRGKIFFMISHWPDQKIFGEPNIVTGYTYRTESIVTASIGSQKFEFFTEGDAAWLADPKEEQGLLSAMRKGSVMIIKGTSSRNTVTTDRYSLLGISAALDKIDAACK